MLTLHAEKRDIKEKNDTLRAEGKLPGVLYGRKEASTAITLDAEKFRKALGEAGESTVIAVEGLGDEKQVLIHDVQLHPVKDTVQHVDLYAIEKGKKVEVHVPLEFVGAAPAVKNLGGTLVKVLHELHIEALPKDLPGELTVDISSLVDFDAQISVQDIALPEGVVALLDAEETVALVSRPKEEEEEEEPTEIDMSAIEVEQKGKEEEEDASSSEDSKEE